MSSSDKVQIDASNLPDHIFPTFQMSTPNERIIIFSGEYKLVSEGHETTVLGELYFQWLPNCSVRFKGEIMDAVPGATAFRIFDRNFLIKLNDIEVGQIFLTRFNFAEHPKIEGVLISNSVIGDKSVPVSRIRFSIPNLRDFLGANTRIEREGTLSIRTSRLKFEDEKYIIIIDRIPDFEERKELLSKNGGFLILYGGEITSKKGNISYDDLTELHSCLNTYLTFLNGRKCSPILYQGVFDDEVIWSDYTGYTSDSFKSVTTWPQAHSVSELGSLWQSFRVIWEDPNGKDFLKSVIHWYSEANSNTGYLEGSLILAQIALELIYNWYVIEKRQVICGKDATNISASNKIRLLLAQVNGSASIPTSFTNLNSYLSSNQRINDGVDIIVQIRNAIVHAQQEQRIELLSTKAGVKFEARELALWYIEYSLLYILEFKGKYFNRTSGKDWAGDGEEESPYTKTRE